MESEDKMQKQKFSNDVKKRLGVLWVLLNISTEYRGDSDVVCSVMDMIEKAYPQAPKMWRKNFKIIVDGKIIYEFDNSV